jgi:hypothetical protein
MKYVALVLFGLSLNVNAQQQSKVMESIKPTNSFTCKLTTPELQKRKETILKDLQSKVLEKQSIKDGFRFRFRADDESLQMLFDFVKTERLCCDFFNFSISVPGNPLENAWLEISGPAGVSDFIEAELGL